ncbi:membrane c-type cytochrome cy [hydrothermal vent metagenome]|uniref:Membrane c-type cytochrome cy n=1 Tax=hydrothermal vent metagenome TaxID=652676 RepID=A0A3B0SWD4_9ZZZZ
MNSFELNKIALALLLTVLIIFGIAGLTGIIFEEKELATNAYPIEGTVADVATPDEDVVAAVEEGPSLADLLAVASLDKGVKVFKKCKACHTIDNGGKNLVGPNLWDVVGRAKAGASGFSYSDAMKSAGGEWTYEELDGFLKKPSGFIPKTKMTFAGLKKSADRAAVIVLLRSLSDAPHDLPSVAIPETEAGIPEEVSTEAPQE